MKKQKEERSHHPHTKFFESAFSNQTVARDFIEQFFPKEFVKKLNTQKLKIKKGSFLTNKLRRLYADILYECPYGEGEDIIRLQFLMEHKSTPEPFPFLQFLSYKLEIWKKQKEQKEALTPIIPILFYHGEKKWKQNKFEDMFKGIDDKIRPFLPSFEYYLVDLAKFTDEQILNLRRSFLMNTLLTFKHYKEKNYILAKLDLVFSLTLKDHELNLYDVLFRYIILNNANQ